MRFDSALRVTPYVSGVPVLQPRFMASTTIYISELRIDLNESRKRAGRWAGGLWLDLEQSKAMDTIVGSFLRPPAVIDAAELISLAVSPVLGGAHGLTSCGVGRWAAALCICQLGGEPSDVLKWCLGEAFEVSAGAAWEIEGLFRWVKEGFD